MSCVCSQKQNLYWERDPCILMRAQINTDSGFFLCHFIQSSESIFVAHWKTYGNINIFTFLNEYLYDVNHAPKKIEGGKHIKILRESNLRSGSHWVNILCIEENNINVLNWASWCDSKQQDSLSFLYSQT